MGRDESKTYLQLNLVLAEWVAESLKTGPKTLQNWSEFNVDEYFWFIWSNTRHWIANWVLPGISSKRICPYVEFFIFRDIRILIDVYLN